jgi:hypothetical protein
MNATVLARALGAGLLLAAAAVGGEPEVSIRLVTEIKEDPASDLKLDWVIHTYVAGENLLVTSHRDGRINVFRRDVKTGDVKFLGFHDLASQLKHPGRHLDAYPALTDKNILYATGEWTHSRGNVDSLGLSWYRFDPKDGSLKLLGNIPCDAGALLLAPDRKSLYLTAWHTGAIYPVSLDAEGQPAVGAKVAGKGLGRDAVLSTDGRFIYSLTDKDLGWVEIKNDGTLAYGGSCELAPLEPPAGGMRSVAMAVSPDGKHAYAWLWTYKYSATGLFNRDPKTGALTFAGKLDVDPGMQGVNHVEFAADGKTGFCSAGPETPGSCLGWFRRDPESGKLAFGGKAPKSPPPCHFAYCPDSGALYVAGYWSTKSFWVYSAR